MAQEQKIFELKFMLTTKTTERQLQLYVILYWLDFVDTLQ